MTNMDRGTTVDGPSAGARLRAIVAVDFEHRVRCQQPGCGHSVHAAVHVVEEAGQLLVLGSTCFARRYGSAGALGSAQYGGGSGRELTDEERLLLAENTRELLSHFEAEDARSLAAASQPQPPSSRLRSVPGLAAPPSSPWPWQLPDTSVALFEGPDGTHWVRVQHTDRSQKLVPWPEFSGWDSTLPAEIGEPNHALGKV